jgi:hypothetical protein
MSGTGSAEKAPVLAREASSKSPYLLLDMILTVSVPGPMLFIGTEPGRPHREYVAMLPCTDVAGDPLNADVDPPDDRHADRVCHLPNLAVGTEEGRV